MEYNSAQAHFSTYYRTKDSSELLLSLQTLNLEPVYCPEFRQRVSALKISTLFLLGRYTDVARFIDSCRPEDFAKAYQKPFSKNIALAKAAERSGKTQFRDSFYRENLSLITAYLAGANPSRTDTTAVYDYFYTESQVLPEKEFTIAIDSAVKKQPRDSVLLNAMRRSFYKTDSTIRK